MKTVDLGPVKDVTPDFNRFPVPRGARFLRKNTESGFIQFEVDENARLIVLEEGTFQFLDENTGRYVKVQPKDTSGPFKKVPFEEI